MVEELQELYKYRELLCMIAYRDIKIRYKQSIMGFMWAILMPIIIVASGIIVRYAYALAAHKPLDTADIASVAVKSIPWAFLVSSLRFGCNSLILGNKDLVTKIYFPKEIFPLAAVVSSFFDFIIASGALLLFLLGIKIGVSIYLVWVPVLIAIMVLMSCGIGMIAAAASLFFRDVKFIVEILLTFGIFFTPVFYDVSMLGDKGKWLMLNPLAPVLDGFGACIARHQQPDLHWLAYSLVFALVSSLGGYIFFKHLEPAFAESI
jgi:lipopolysaccharide transport system permease protein